MRRKNPDERTGRLQRAWANDGSAEAARAYLGALKRSSKMASRMVDRLDSLWDLDWGVPPRGLVELIWLVSTGRMETDRHAGGRSRVGAVIVSGNVPLGTVLFHASVGPAPLCLQCARTESGFPDYADRHVCGRWGEFEGESLVHLGARTHIVYPLPATGPPYQTTHGAVSGGSSMTYAVPQEIAVLWSRAHGGGEARQNPPDPDEGKPPNPRREVCRKCGNWIMVLDQYCLWDGKPCAPGYRNNPYHGTQEDKLRSIRKRGLVFPFISSQEGQAWCWADGYAGQGFEGRVLEVEIPDPYLLVPDFNDGTCGSFRRSRYDP